MGKSDKKMRLTSTPTLSRLQVYSPPTSHISPVYGPQMQSVSTNQKGTTQTVQNTTYDLTPSVNTYPPNVITSSVTADSSSFCARPPIRIEFPSFGDSCESA